MRLQLLQPSVIPFLQPYVNPEYGTVSSFLRDNPGARGVMHYAVIYTGDPKIVVQTTTLKPVYVENMQIITGSVLDWRSAYHTCEDHKFLVDCYEFIKKQTEIFRIKREGAIWRVLP